MVFPKNKEKIFFFLFLAIAFSAASFLFIKCWSFVFMEKSSPLFVDAVLQKLLKIKEKELANIPISLKFYEDIRQDLTLQQKDFLELNFEDMRVRLFKKGTLEQEFPILARGNPKAWGGSAAGISEVIEKYRIGYSNVAQVYMPYAINYYGMYFVHGEPYYPWGKKLVSYYSGGCIRLRDNFAKELFSLVEPGFLVLSIDKNKDVYQYSLVEGKEEIEPPELSATSYLLADLDSGFIFAQKNPREKLCLASLTKLMTAVVTVENIGFTRPIKITEDMLSAYGETEGLEKGKWFRVIELLYPVLIESSNDAAKALSYFMGKEKTIEAMNKKAKSILMENTLFVDPTGYEPGNVSTVEDLFYLARYVLNNHYLFLPITKGQKVYSFGEIDFNLSKLWNKNIFIDDPTFIGGKTGFIEASKHTGVFIFKLTASDGTERNIAIIILNSSNVKADTQRAYIWLQKNYFPQAQGQ